MAERDSQLSDMLGAGLEELGLALHASTQDSLLEYLHQLQRWNKAFNLSGIRDPAQMLTHHLLDSLAVVPFIDVDLIADVGTGAGLPGVPLALCFPDKQFRLIDSNGKKTRFVFQTVAHLGIRNVEVINKRVEDYESHPQVAIVLSRAFTALKDFVLSCDHLLADGGRFLAMKGQLPEPEIAALPPGFNVVGSHPLQVPGISAARHIVDIRRSP